MEKTFSTVTIGCKLNQYETEVIREALIRKNWTFLRLEDGAAFCIINSCAVTSRSDARSRNAARRAKRANPDSFVVMTGCSAETQPESLGAMKEVDLVLGNGKKSRLPAIIDSIAGKDGGEHPELLRSPVPGETAEEGGINRFFGRSRAFVKIQEGCNASCSYCIVPRARGPSRSVPAAGVVEQVARLRGNGYCEVVLSGVHIGRYGADLDPPSTLLELIEEILTRVDSVRVRLSSIEMNEVTPGLLSLIRATDRIAPHFHVPLQSGDDRILEAMNRSYRASDFRIAMENIARARDGIAIGTDIIVGFPGESESCFENTFNLVRDLPISYFHVFSFSPRPQTAAAGMPGAVSAIVKRERSRRLIELGTVKKRAFLESHVGSTQTALVHGPAHGQSPYVRSLTGTYCEVLLPNRSGRPGSLVPIRVNRFSRGTLYGTAVEGAAASKAITEA